MKKMIIMMTMIFILCASFSNSLSVEAASKKSGSKRWAKEYMKILKKMHKEDSKYYNNSYTYDLIYFNNDSIPEFIVGIDGYWVSMYTYDKKKKKVYTVMDRWGYGAGGNPGYEYLPKKNTLLNYNSDHAGAERYVFCGKMKNHKIVDRNKKTLVMKQYIDKNHNGYPDDGEYTEKTYYYYGKKKVSKKRFNSYIKSGKYKYIIGRMSYKKMKKKLKAKGA